MMHCKCNATKNTVVFYISTGPPGWGLNWVGSSDGVMGKILRTTRKRI